MKLFNWINPLWIMDTFLTTRFDPISATAAAAAAAEAIPAVAAPSILGGGLTGAGMMTAGAPIVPGILASSTPGLMSGLGALGSAGLQYAKDNPFQTAGLGLGIYDRMNPQSQPIQAQPGQLIRNQSTLQYQPALQTRIPQSTYPRKLY
jgi:hypothetical protein